MKIKTFKYYQNYKENKVNWIKTTIDFNWKYENEYTESLNN